MAADLPPSIAPQQVSGLVLAGGQGRRMQPPTEAGHSEIIEKGLLTLHGRPLVDWALDGLPDGRACTYISANRCQTKYARYGRVVADNPALGCAAGPLHGVASVLQQCATPWLMVVPVDVPLVPADLFPRLAQAAARFAQPTVAYARTAARSQPLFMLIPTALLTALQHYLHGGGRRVQYWQQLHGAPVTFPDQSPVFDNINTPEDLRRAACRVVVSRSGSP